MVVEKRRARRNESSGDESSSSVPTVRATAQPFSMRVKERLRAPHVSVCVIRSRASCPPIHRRRMTIPLNPVYLRLYQGEDQEDESRTKPNYREPDPEPRVARKREIEGGGGPCTGVTGCTQRALRSCIGFVEEPNQHIRRKR